MFFWNNQPQDSKKLYGRAIWYIVLLLILLLGIHVLTGNAHSAPPEGANPILAPFYKSLTTKSGSSCCDMSDCRPTDDWRTSTTGYEVLYKGKWQAVPDHAVLQRNDNPTGKAVLCASNYTEHIYCFLPGVLY